MGLLPLEHLLISPERTRPRLTPAKPAPRPANARGGNYVPMGIDRRGRATIVIGGGAPPYTDARLLPARWRLGRSVDLAGHVRLSMPVPTHGAPPLDDQPLSRRLAASSIAPQAAGFFTDADRVFPGFTTHEPFSGMASWSGAANRRRQAIRPLDKPFSPPKVTADGGPGRRDESRWRTDTRWSAARYGSSRPGQLAQPSSQAQSATGGGVF